MALVQLRGEHYTYLYACAKNGRLRASIRKLNMGLHIHTLSKIPRNLEKDWYIYLLEYGPQEPFTMAMKGCFDEMANWASEGNSVVIRGTNPVHFADEVFSWHQIAGLDGDDVLPAIMISTINPSVFTEFGDRDAVKHYSPNDKVVVISLRDFNQNADQVYSFVRKLLRELSSGTKLTELSVVKSPKRGMGRRIFDAIKLTPSIAGFGIDIKTLLGK